MSSSHRRSVLLFLVCLVGFNASTTPYSENCDPLVPEFCYYPFPNDFWTDAVKDTPTGIRLNLNMSTLPNPRSEPKRFDPHYWNQLDGFAPSSSLLTYFPDPDLSNVARWWNIGKSLEPDSVTILYDATTKERIAHWVELDERAKKHDLQSFVIWPARALDNGRQYIVAVRGLKSASTGRLINATAAFTELRDGTASADPRVNGRRQHFKNLFATLATIGVKKEELQICWDFTTASSTALHSDMLYMRDDALARMPKDGPDFTIVNVEKNPKGRPHTNRYITGVMRVPSYLTTMEPSIHSHIVYNTTMGHPQFQRFEDVFFKLSIPNSLANTKKRGWIMNYGHGLFGTYNEIKEAYLQFEANEHGYVIAGVDWIGMAQDDKLVVLDILTSDFTKFKVIPDRLTQSMVNHEYLTALLMSEKFITAPDMMPTGAPLIDPTHHYYYGNSNGGCLGTTFVSYSTIISRGVLGVPGGTYNMLLLRSIDFTPFFKILSLNGNEMDLIFWLTLFEQLWARAGPGGYARSLIAHPLPGTPPKTVAIHYALGDAQVTWLAGQYLGRSANASMFQNNVRERNETLFGFPITNSPASRPQVPAVIQGWDFNAPPVPLGDFPPDGKTDTHECARRDPRAMDAIYTLFKTGTFQDWCNGTGCHPLKPARKLFRCPLPDMV
eukprot:TRINITY_DN65303_c0_g2_i1.p1 TRINITY_DN65303_c0_g2~~TRINITY_DN65303_c0_g2_i1.p1  ORF type:complete len:667 (+),score=41.82 TRINITY_DN65303_c0_g2_i1:43-2043(+)